MAVIFYAVSGEGMGHATRSEVVIKHLLKLNYKIVIFSYERAFEYLNNTFKKHKNVLEIVEITGINLVYEKNEFNVKKTILRVSKKFKNLFFENFLILTNKIIKYSPRVIITDFEPASGIVAKLLKLPLICLDNIGFYTKCDIDKRFKKPAELRFIDCISVFKGDFNFVLSVFDVPVKKEYKKNTCLMCPIIRTAIIEAKKVKKKHFLVYQTSTSNEKLFEILKLTKETYIVYGFNEEKVEGNLIFKKNSVKGFALDLSSAKGVITNGGFTLISEAVFLKIPIYSIPVKKQFEQEINGFYLKKQGYGIFSAEINIHDLNYFIAHLEKYKKNLVSKNIKINEFALLDKKIKDYATYSKKPLKYNMLLKLKKNYDALIKRSSKFIKKKDKN